MRSMIAAVVLAAATVSLAQAPAAFTLKDIDGVSHTLPAEQTGVGIYLFWASWCPYCKALMPHIQSIVDEYGDRVTVYALNFRDRHDPALLIEENGYEFVVLPDAGDVAASWEVHGTPGLLVIDESKAVRFNLYDVVTENPPGYDALTHSQKAVRRAPFWAARIRATLDELHELRD